MRYAHVHRFSAGATRTPSFPARSGSDNIKSTLPLVVNICLAKCIAQVKNINGEAILVQRYGWSASSLWWAAYHGHIHIIEELMKSSKIDINKKRQYNGTTPLMISCYQGKIEAAMLLLRKGANVLIEDENGYTALTCALRSNITALREDNQRYQLSMFLLRRYPRHKLDEALQEVQDRCPGLLNKQDISILQALQGQRKCRQLVLR
ncbi:unnamed protein product, partial [Meganyctiphanes norvegica]